MGRISRGEVFLPFALLSLLTLAVIAGGLAWSGTEAVSRRMRQEAAQSTAAAVAPIVKGRVSDLDLRSPLPEASRAELDARVADLALLPGSASRLRFWNTAGLNVYSTDAHEIGMGFVGSDELRRAFDGQVVSSVAASDLATVGGDIFRVYTPIRIPGDAVAVLEIDQPYAPIAQAITSDQKEWLLLVSGGMAILYAVLQGVFWATTRVMTRQYERLSYLYTTSQDLRSSLELAEIMGSFVLDSVILARGSHGVLALLDEASRDLVLKVSYDHGKRSTEHHNRRVDEWFLGRAMATGEPLTVKLAEHPYKTVFGFGHEVEGPVSILSMPMRLRDGVTGVLVVIRHPSTKEFEQAETSLVAELAGQAAMAIEQASLFVKVRAHASELEKSYDATLKALMAALDTKDAATEGHSERVAKLTVKVARELGIEGERLLHIERGALLHDVGKIGVPDDVLRKPEALTKAEWEAMQKHPLLAGLMVSKVGFLEGAMPIVLYHHERYDGGGYPFGLSGDHIPLEARIFAVADTYDAITSERPYRSAGSPRAAVEEIKANAGTQFDPAVVEAFVAVMERELAERESGEIEEAA